MQISLFDDYTGIPIDLSKDYKVYNVKCFRSVKLTDEQVEESCTVLKYDLEGIQKLSLDSESRIIEMIKNEDVTRDVSLYTRFAVFTKYPALYLDLKRDGVFQYPYYYSPARKWTNKVLEAGSGRSLINFFYFPDVDNDVVDQHPDYGIGGLEVVNQVVDFISTNTYWKDRNTDNVIVGLSKMSRQGDSHLFPDQHDIYFIKNVDFVSKEFLDFKNVMHGRTESFHETTCTVDEWYRMKEQLMNMVVRNAGKKELKMFLDSII